MTDTGAGAGNGAGTGAAQQMFSENICHPQVPRRTYRPNLKSTFVIRRNQSHLSS